MGAVPSLPIYRQVMIEGDEMKTKDTLTQYYKNYLEGTYDCVDRIVLRAYYPYGVQPGGVRVWWRSLFGNDDDLDDTHMMRLAGRFSRRFNGWAKKNNIPVIECKKGDRKHDMARDYIPDDPEMEGVFAVFVSRATAPVWKVQRSGKKGLFLYRKKPMPFVKHYSFHIWDRDWGHLTIRMSGHFPWPAMIILNGHEYVSCQAKKEAIPFTKVENCFTYFRGTTLNRITETLRSPDAVGCLEEACERWIYQCLCFGLSFNGQQLTGFKYHYTVLQMEYSRNLIFKRGKHLDRIFDGIIDRNRTKLDVSYLKMIFGRRTRPLHRTNKPRLEVMLEKPDYNMTVFKMHFGKLTLKMYSKGERVLRTEAIVHNTKALKCRRSLDGFPSIAAELGSYVQHFMESIKGLDLGFYDQNLLDKLSQPSQLGKTPIGGINLNSTRMNAVLKGLMTLAVKPKGFKSGELAKKISRLMGRTYSTSNAAYDIRKLRAKGLVEKIKTTQRYGLTRKGLPTIVGLITLKEKIIGPLMASRGRIRKIPNRFLTPIDKQYQTLTLEMAELLKLLQLSPTRRYKPLK